VLYWPAAVTQLVGGAVRRLADRVVDAGYRTEIFIYSFDVMVGHVRKGRPWHDLEKVAVRLIVEERLRHRPRYWYGSTGNAIVYGSLELGDSRNVVWRVVDCLELSRGAGWMDVVEIGTVPQDLFKLCQRNTAFRDARAVRCQISRDDGPA